MNIRENKVCRKHGLTPFRVSKKYSRCCKCAVEAVDRKRKSLKLKAIHYKGGKCKDCNLVSDIPGVYEFHHEGGKDFGIASNGYTRAWDKVKQELDKCILLCANCHRVRHHLERSGDRPEI